MGQSVQVKKVSNWMQALSDWMILNPQARAYDAAEFFGVTEAWLSTVKNSDAFKQFHQMRRDQHFDRISEDVGGKLQNLAEISLDELTERVEEERDQMSIQTLHDLSKMAVGALGFGNRGGGVVINQHNDNRSVLVNDQNALAESRERLAAIRKENDKALLESRVTEVEAEKEDTPGQFNQGVAVGAM